MRAGKIKYPALLLPPGWIKGLLMSHAADTDHDIVVTAGYAKDATDVEDMYLAAAITKQFDATWAVGTGQGGMSVGENIAFELMTLDVAPGAPGWAVGNTITGNTSAKTCKIAKVLTTTTYYTYDRTGAFTVGEILTNGTTTADQGAAKPTFALQVGTLHIWLIKRSDTGVIDVVGNINEISGITPTLPANYDYKRLIGSYLINVTSNIINGDWWGTGVLRTFMFDTPILSYGQDFGTGNALTISLHTPGGVVCKAIMNIAPWGTGYISALNNADMAQNSAAAPLYSGLGQAYVFTNTLSQIRVRGSGPGAISYLATLGWEQAL